MKKILGCALSVLVLILAGIGLGSLPFINFAVGELVWLVVLQFAGTLLFMLLVEEIQDHRIYTVTVKSKWGKETVSVRASSKHDAAKKILKKLNVEIVKIKEVEL